MPHWVVLLVVTLGAWLVVTVVGGLLVGRALGVVARAAPDAPEDETAGAADFPVHVRRAA